MHAETLMIGTELLLGQIVDTNAAFMARVLAENGIHLYQKTTVGDNPERICAALRAALARADVVLTSGGLGPTADDITRECVAEVLDRPIEFRQDLYDVLEAFFARFGRPMTENNRKQATAPRGATAIENPHTTILGHPTGRLLLAREGYPLDWEKVFDTCAANRVAIEINANCHRLDLDWRQAKRAKERGVKLCIGPDAHSVEGLDDVMYGLGIARKGWLEPGDLLNCMTAEELLAWRSSS